MRKFLENRSKFAAALRGDQPLLVPGVYDALSAQIATRAGFDGVYVGSFATGASLLGIGDVGLLTMTELAEHVGRIGNATALPVLADGETGFYEAANIWRTVQAFEAAGAVGIHLEDNLGGKHSSAPAGLLSIDKMTQRIRAAVEAKSDPNFQIIARSDAVWVNHDLEDCVARLQAYIEAGADAVFPPGMSAAQLATVRARLGAPVMVLGDLPDRPGEDFPSSSIRDYTGAGANLIVLFYFTLGAAAKGVKAALEALKKQGEVRGLGHLVESQAAFEAVMGYDQYEARVARYSRR